MPDAPFEQQEVLVTVPASFDAVARELTLKAAEQAGYQNLRLLEEPQAAFYAWIERHQDWRERVQVGDLILVIDIGGGTTDFTLIAVTEQAGELQLERVAVGEHILLGGDNMDLALARHLEQQLASQGTKLDAMQLHALWQQCRLAKERLLDKSSKKREEPVTILGRGTSRSSGFPMRRMRPSLVTWRASCGNKRRKPSMELCGGRPVDSPRRRMFSLLAACCGRRWCASASSKC
jgi:hypothetical protein